MTTQRIIESGMTFGPYPEGHCFYIEKSETYKHSQQGVQMAEFLLLRRRPQSPPVVWIVEAKSSTPRPETQPNFDQFIDDIREKLINAFSMGMATCLRRHVKTREELPDPFRMLNLEIAEFRFVLVIKGHKEAWLSPIQEALNKALHATIQTWALRPFSVVVINDDLAKSHGLITS